MGSVNVHFIMTPLTNQSGVFVDIPIRCDGLAYDAQSCSYVVFGVRFEWDTPGSNDLNLRLVAKKKGTTSRRGIFYLNNDANSNIAVTNAVSRNEMHDGDGTGHRYVQGDLENLQVRYDSGTSAGGSLHVTIIALMEPPKT